MATTPLQSFPIPNATGEAPNGAANLAAFGTAIEKQVVMRFANASARDTAIPLGSRVAGMVAYLTDTGVPSFWDGTAWTPLVRRRTLFLNRNGTASGTLPIGSEVTIGGTYTIPASPFGLGEQYLCTMYAQTLVNAVAGTGGEMRLYLDSVIQSRGLGYNAASSAGSLMLHTGRSFRITTPDVTHVVDARGFNTGAGGFITFFADSGHSFFNIILQRYEDLT